MIKVFGKTDKSFLSNGDLTINPVKAKIKKADNTEFYLEIEAGLEYVDYLIQDNIIVSPTPQGEQPFRIGNVTKTKNKILFRADHVFYDSKNYLIEDSYVYEKTCNDALDHLNMATEPQSPFTTISNVNSINSFRCVRKSLYEAIMTVIERWGGHLVWDGFTISIRNEIGTDNGVTVEYAKNLKDITCSEDWSKVVTKLLPVGRDGLMLPEVYLTSDIQYEIPYTKTVSFNQDLDKENYESDEDYNEALITDLRTQATLYLNENKVPKVNYSLKANLEKITDIGDTVMVNDKRLGISILTNVISYEYDPILKKYTNVEFGNFRKSLSGLMSGISTQISNTVSEETQTVRVELGEELAIATDKIMSVLGNSYVIYDGNQILVVDSLPKETAHNVMRINAGGIGFSQNGINGTFNSAWTIDGTLDMQQINVINLTANLIKGGTLKLGSESNVSGILELYGEANNLIGLMNKDGLKMYGLDGSYVLMNNEVGFAGYDRNNTKIYWVASDEFHMRKSVVEEEITLCNKMRFIPITIYNGNTMVNDGIGLVSSLSGGN